MPYTTPELDITKFRLSDILLASQQAEEPEETRDDWETSKYGL